MTEEPESRGPEKLLLAGLGLASLTAERADELADAIARRLGVERETARGVVSDVLTSWRSELERLGDHRSDAGERALARVGLVRQEELEELSLRLAQVEHRLRLLERAGEGVQPVRTTRDVPGEQTTATDI